MNSVYGSPFHKWLWRSLLIAVVACLVTLMTAATVRLVTAISGPYDPLQDKELIHMRECLLFGGSWGRQDGYASHSCKAGPRQ
jgi:hypothetical protein